MRGQILFSSMSHSQATLSEANLRLQSEGRHGCCAPHIAIDVHASARGISKFPCMQLMNHGTTIVSVRGLTTVSQSNAFVYRG